MGTARRPEKVKMIVALLLNDTALLGRVSRTLERSLRNRIDFESSLVDFVHTDYYREEMGRDLKRKFLSFADNIPLKDIEKVKLITNRIEKRYSERGKRRINIDPGYLDLSKLVLFSTKDYTHRVYIGRNIFAESTLFFQNGTFNAWPWTYPDYASRELIAYFNEVRNIYMDDLNKK